MYLKKKRNKTNKQSETVSLVKCIVQYFVPSLKLTISILATELSLAVSSGSGLGS